MDSEDRCLMNCDLFGRLAEYFEAHVVPLWQDVYDSLASRAEVGKGETVLDVGTGTGEVALRISKRVGAQGRVVGVDIQKEMLAIAKRKARSRGLDNIDFMQTSLEELDLPDSHFDSVVGNYSLCCTLNYEAALAECLRVLKPGGRLTYNHGGLSDPVESRTVYDVFERHKPKNPSKRLNALRESDEAQMKGFEKYRDPHVVLTALKKAGFRDVKASIIPRRISYPDPAAYVERMIEYDLRSEVEEMKPADVRKFRREAVRALSSLSNGPGLTVSDETVYFTGRKSA